VIFERYKLLRVLKEGWCGDGGLWKNNFVGFNGMTECLGYDTALVRIGRATEY
jgi:hypothetical protein